MIKDKLAELIRARPGLTATELSEELFGSKEGYQQRVNQDCNLLLDDGVVERRGEGGRSDPFRYFATGVDAKD